MKSLLLLLLLQVFMRAAQPAIPDNSATGIYNGAQQKATKNQVQKVNYLKPGVSIFSPEPPTRFGLAQAELRIYCFRGLEKTLLRLFVTNELRFDIDGEDYTQYEGATPEEVLEHYDEQRYRFTFTLLSQKRARLALNTFANQCIGVETSLQYRVVLQQQHIDFWRVLQLVLGVLLFIYASTLSQNAVFYYLTGVLLGIGLSLICLIWLVSKLLPKKKMMYASMFFGWGLCCFVLYTLWENLQTIILTYRSYVFWYICLTGLISFFVCYRWGPPENERSKNLIKWSLQLAALLIVYFSSHFEEATAAIIILTVTLKVFPRSWLRGIMKRYHSRFPPKRRLLTTEEFYEQGARETAKALEELRQYASSPECKQWRLMSKLKDPRRFADFVEGSSHLQDEELLSFEQSHYEQPDTDDSDLTEDEQVLNEQPRHGHLQRRLQQQEQQFSRRFNSTPTEARSFAYQTAEQMSDDNEDNEEDDEAEFASPSNSARVPYFSANNQHVNSMRYSKHTPTATATATIRERRASPLVLQQSSRTKTTASTSQSNIMTRTTTRSARMLASAQQMLQNNSSYSSSNSRSRRVEVTTAQDDVTSDEN